MGEKEFDYEEYRNNLEKAAEIHDKFYRFRNLVIYFILYSVLYTFVIGTQITNVFLMFLSLVIVYWMAKIVTYLFDEIRFSIRVLKNKRKMRNNND